MLLFFFHGFGCAQRLHKSSARRRLVQNFGWCDNWPQVRNQKRGVLAKGVFAEIRRFSSHCCSCTVCTATWHPMCPLANSPYLSALLVCLSSICSKGCHVSWRQARYRTTCKLAEPKYSTAFDKNEKTHLCRSRVCLCRLPCESRRTSCCATSFRQFPRLSANFRDFPPLSATFRHFPPISANFRDFPHPLLAQ